jgi:hypothetical protein
VWTTPGVKSASRERIHQADSIPSQLKEDWIATVLVDVRSVGIAIAGVVE